MYLQYNHLDIYTSHTWKWSLHALMPPNLCIVALSSMLFLPWWEWQVPASPLILLADNHCTVALLQRPSGNTVFSGKCQMQVKYELGTVISKSTKKLTALQRPLQVLKQSYFTNMTKQGHPCLWSTPSDTFHADSLTPEIPHHLSQELVGGRVI